MGLLLGCLLQAQPRLINYGSFSGLPSNTVYAIAQDATGHLWIGTRNGLCRFDGTRMESWKEYGRVNALTVDNDGRIWIGTTEGLSVRCPVAAGHDDAARRVTASSGRYVIADSDRQSPAVTGNIRALHTDSDGAVWATVGDTLALKLSYKSGIHEEAHCFYDKRDSEGDYPYYQIYEAQDGRLWLGGRIVRTQFIENRDNPSITRLFGNGGFCSGSYAEKDGKFYAFDDHTSILYSLNGPEAIPVGRLPISHTRLLKDQKGRLWAAGSYGFGPVNLEKPEETPVYKTPSTELFCIFEDRQGNIWVGGDNGLSVLCPALQKVQQISDANVTALMQDSHGKMWIGKAHDHVSSLYEDSEGTVYVGLWNSTGWEVWKGGKMHKERLSGLTPELQQPAAQTLDGANWISDFLEDSKGRFWVVSWEGVGLNLWDRKAGKSLPPRWLSPFRYPSPQVDSNIYVSSRLGSRLIEDASGNLIYATTQAGLNVIDANTGLVTKYYKGNSSIPDDYVTDLCLTPGGTVWAATRSGLWRCPVAAGHDGSNVIADSDRQSVLEGKLVQCVESDASGRLWAGTEDGLYVVDTDGSIGRVPKELGFPSDIYGERVSCTLNDGSLAFGGASGAAAFNPDSLLSIDTRGNLPLSNLIRHRYRVNKGDWVYESFNGLPDKIIPGRYTLQEQTSDIFGRWEKGESSTRIIRVRPPLLLRWPFLILYALIVAGGIWLLVRYRENRQRAALLQEELETRNRFFGIISHDLRGPVNGMRTLASSLSQAPENKLRDGIRAIGAEAEHTSAMLENILMWSVNQKGVLEPVFTEENLADLVSGVVSLMHSAASEKSVRIATDIPEALSIRTDRHMLSTCLRNLLDNAVKYSPAGGTVSVWGSASKIIIADNGPGIPPDTLLSLSRPGHLGLVITRELLEKMGASISARNLPEGGCEITVTL